MTDLTSENSKIEKGMPLLSIVTPMYNESENVAKLHERLSATLDANDIDWEWIIVEDHSQDDTFDKVRSISNKHPNVRGVRLAKNTGTHLASCCGLQLSRGQCVVIMASDLQDPPELIPELLDKWKQGAQVVWAARQRREGESVLITGPSKLYYWLLKKFADIPHESALGADFFLLDRRVTEALNQHGETHVSILALIARMGFRQETIFYNKKKREHGESGWTLEKKLKLLVDSIISFTYKPIRFMSYLGVIVALIGFAYAAYIVSNALSGNPAEGWSSLMVVILLVGGIQMIMLGVLGEYLWRTLDESRKRPRFLIQEEVGFKKDSINTTVKS